MESCYIVYRPMLGHTNSEVKTVLEENGDQYNIFLPAGKGNSYKRTDNLIEYHYNGDNIYSQKLYVDWLYPSGNQWFTGVIPGHNPHRITQQHMWVAYNSDYGVRVKYAHKPDDGSQGKTNITS